MGKGRRKDGCPAVRTDLLIVLGILGTVVSRAGSAETASEPSAIVGDHEFHYEHDHLPAGVRAWAWQEFVRQL